MSVHVPASTADPSERVRDDLRSAVLREIRARGLDDPDALAKHLEILPIAADGLLQRRRWPVETSLWLISRLDLPIEVSITIA
jgi:hypothetical protein